MKNGDYWNKIESKLLRIGDFIKDKCIYYGLEATSFPNSIIGICVLNMIKRKRKLIGFYGECHIYVYGEILNSISLLKKNYCIVGAKEIEYLARWHHKEINRKEAWDRLDVLIYNPGVPNRKDAPTLEQVLKWVPKTCKKIEVTNAVFMGYMPQHTERVFENNGYFAWGDRYLNKLLESDNITVEMLKSLEGGEFISKDRVNKFFEKSLKHMKMYEQKCTIKIADYIEKYGQKRVLYYSVTHPEMEIMREISRRILIELGIDKEDCMRKIYRTNVMFDLHSHGEAVYPSVIKGLGIEMKEDRVVQYGNYKEISYSFHDYIKEYIKMGMKERRK